MQKKYVLSAYSEPIMSDIFRTINGPTEAIYTEKRSKFLAFAYHVASVEEVKEIIAGLNKKYFDARHVCWAYMLGPERLEFRANDNGEPSGTAGKPILGQINSYELTDILIAVVRYFGGVKLGTSGLITAYRQAARDAIENAEIIECHRMKHLSFTFPYMAMNDVMKISRFDGVTVTGTTFDNTCLMELDIELDRYDEIFNRLSDIDGVTLND